MSCHPRSRGAAGRAALRAQALAGEGRFGEAIRAYRQAIRLWPEFAEGYNNLAGALLRLGRVERAIETYRQALQLRPDLAGVHSNLLFTLHYGSAVDADSLFREHQAWSARHAPARRYSSYPSTRSIRRRLRVGYLTTTFRFHPGVFFLAPLLAEHDRRRFEVFCYTTTDRADAYTARIRSLADGWRNVSKLSDEQAAVTIHRDRIDILVDRDGHFGGNRLGVFAMRPAPVQVSIPGYPDTSGLPEVGYRITDACADPPGRADARYTEELVRLPAFACYEPPAEAPPVGPAPALRNGYATFGCFNNRPKYSDRLLRLWACILLRVPRSRILFHHVFNGRPQVSSEFREPILRVFEACGVSRRRVRFVGGLPLRAHLELYGEIDILLDTFPYNGNTTTCEALWMGVPVITQAGETHVSRVGLSHLASVGLGDWAAASENDYAALAVAKAAQARELARIRRRLRAQMAASRLTDAGQYARAVEAAYKKMWRRWCEGCA